MALTPIAVTLIIFAAVFFLVLNLLRSLAKAITITLFIMFLLGLFVSYLIISDAKEFSDAINNNISTYLLDEEGTIRTGFQAHRLNISTFKALELDEIEKIQEEPPGKVFIIKKEILTTQVKIPELENVGLSVKSMLESSSAEQRAQVFALLLGKTIEEEGPLEMVLYIRDENILIKPKTPVVYVVTSTPRQLFKQAKSFVLNEADKRLDVVREEVGI